MGLRPHEQRILDQIEAALRTADPKLAGMLSVFSRLTAHERLPSEERPVAAPRPTGAGTRVRRPRLAAAAWPGLMRPHQMPSRRVGALLPLLTVVLVAGMLTVSLVVVAGQRGSRGTSTAVCSMAAMQVPACQPGALPRQTRHPADG